MKKLWVNENNYIYLSERNTLTEEIATRNRSIDFYALVTYLPNPDLVLKAQGKDIKTYKEMLTDAHLGGCISSRKSGITSLEWEIDRGKSKSRQAKLIEDVFKNLDLHRIITEMLDGVLFGYQPLEVIWQKSGSYILPRDIVGKPPEWFCFNSQNQLLFRTREKYEGEAVPERKFLLARNNPTYANPYGFPELSRCFWPITFKRGGLKFWIMFTEKYGMPYLVGKKPRGTSKEETDAFADMLENMIQDAIAVIPDDSSVEIKEASGKGASAQIYSQLLEFCKTEVSIAILGQNLTTEVKGGSYAAAQSHMAVRKDIIDNDRKLVESVFNTLIRWIYEINFSAGDMPVFSMYEEEDVDKTLAERDEILSRTGIKFTKKYYMREYGFNEDDIEIGSSASQGLPQQFAEATAQFTPEQQAIEDLKSAASDKWEDVLSPIIEPILSIINESTTYDEAKAKIMEAFNIMDDSELTELLARALFISDTYGRLNAEGN